MTTPTTTTGTHGPAIRLETTRLPMLSGRFIGMFLITNSEGWPFSNFALATTKEDAELIVRACNSYESYQRKIAALVEALTGILASYDAKDTREIAKEIERSRAALSRAQQAEGQS